MIFDPLNRLCYQHEMNRVSLCNELRNAFLIVLFVFSAPLFILAADEKSEEWRGNRGMLRDCRSLLQFTTRHASKLIQDVDFVWNSKKKSRPHSQVVETFLVDRTLPIHGGGILVKGLEGEPDVFVETAPDWSIAKNQWMECEKDCVDMNLIPPVVLDSNTGWRENHAFIQSRTLIPSFSVDAQKIRWIAVPVQREEGGFLNRFRLLPFEAPESRLYGIEKTLDAEILDFKLIPGSSLLAIKTRRPSGQVAIRFFSMPNLSHKVRISVTANQLDGQEILLPPLPADEERHRKFFTLHSGTLVLMDERIGTETHPSSETQVYSFQNLPEYILVKGSLITGAQQSQALLTEALEFLRFGKGNLIRRQFSNEFFGADIKVNEVDQITDVLEHPFISGLLLVAGKKTDLHFTLNFIDSAKPNSQGQTVVPQMGKSAPRFSAIPDLGGWFISAWQGGKINFYRADEDGMRILAKLALDLPFEIESAGVTVDGRYLYVTSVPGEGGQRVLISYLKWGDWDGGDRGGGRFIIPIPDPRGGMVLPLYSPQALGRNRERVPAIFSGGQKN